MNPYGRGFPMPGPPMGSYPPPMMMSPGGGYRPPGPPQGFGRGLPAYGAPPSGTVVASSPAVRPIDQMTTVFVGKIPAGVEDDFIKKLLEQCGPIKQWKRASDPASGKLKNFGFCDYENAEAVLKCMRLLDKFQLDGAELLVKVNESTQKYLEEYRAKNQAFLNAQKPPTEKPEDGELEDEEKEKEYAHLKNVLNQLMKMRTRGEDYSSFDPSKAVITPPEDEARAKRDIDRIQEMEESFPNDTEKAHLVSREIKYFRDAQEKKEGQEKREDEGRRESRGKSNGQHTNDRAKEKERAQLRKKEADEREFEYRERQWERREADKQRERETDRERRANQHRDQMDIAYDFDEERKRHSNDYYRRKKDREREREEDEAEARSEREALARLQAERDKERMDRERSPREGSRGALPPPPPDFSPGYSPKPATPGHNEDSVFDRSKISGSFINMKSKSNDKKTAPSFGFAEEEDGGSSKKKRKLVTLETTLHEDNTRVQKLEQAKNIIEKIPTEKDKLFDYPVDWDVVEKHNIVQDKMKPWTTKMVGELLGEEDKSLIDFILSKITARNTPTQMLQQLVIVLDDEAETLVVKMWRRFLFEVLSAKGA